ENRPAIFEGNAAPFVTQALNRYIENSAFNFVCFLCRLKKTRTCMGLLFHINSRMDQISHQAGTQGKYSAVLIGAVLTSRESARADAARAATVSRYISSCARWASHS